MSLLWVLAVVGLLIALGLRVCLYLYGAGAVRYNAERESGAAPVLEFNSEAEEATAEAECVASMVRSMAR